MVLCLKVSGMKCRILKIEFIINNPVFVGFTYGS